MDAMQVLRSLRTSKHGDRQLTMNDLTEWELLFRYKFGRNTINFKKCKITNIIRDDTGMTNGQVITQTFHSILIRFFFINI